jgi:benzodiazapine receptor
MLSMDAHTIGWENPLYAQSTNWRFMSSKKSAFLQGINVVVFLVTVAVNALAGSTALLNGKTSGEISDLYPTLVTPAGYTFSIWGLIYTLLLVFIVYQVLPRNREQSFLGQVSFLFALSGLFNALWLFLWHYEIMAFSVILMFALLATLIAIYLRLDVGRASVPLREKVCVHMPFSVYLGWITVASIANVAVALTAVGWDGAGIEPVTWAMLVIAVAVLITLIVIATRKDAAYSLVIAWAIAGIMAKQIENQTVVLTAEVSIAIVLIAIVAMAVASRVKR